ncbi:MAG TPA: RiPP maturation radical SAM C-methyltransferase [Polyangiaceae bacterium]
MALVVMPVHHPSMPSLAVATLSGGLRARGHHVDVLSLNVTAAGNIGLDTYEIVSAEDAWLHNVAEWLFAHPSITPGASDAEAMHGYLRSAGAPRRLAELDLSRLRGECDALIERWAITIDWRAYDVVGFSVVFQQLNASLRLGARIKGRSPATRVVFGGSSMERPMGDAVLTRYPWLDAVFSGYADSTLPAYVEALPPRASEPIGDDGPYDLDELPIPSFDEYLGAVDDAGLRGRIRPQILLETSRGCWYGEKHHCTFCGMNGVQMRFRKKSADRVLEEVRALSRYGLPLWATDNILDMGFFQDLFPRMQAEGVRFPAFFEIKSNLKRDQLETIAALGINRLQPGIESLSTKLLQRMRKGVTGIQNIWFLRASEELGVHNQWNVLYGFPREEREEYAAMAALLPDLSHLEAPTGWGKIHLLRFSPNHTDAANLGFVDVRPGPSYELAFGRHPRLEDQAYVFEHGYDDGRNPATYTRSVDEACSRWSRLKRLPFAPRCEVVDVGGTRWLYDTRRRAEVGRAWPRVRRVSDAEWALLEAIESPIRPEALAQKWSRIEPFEPLLSRFLDERIAAAGDGRVVRLAVIRKDRSPWSEVRRVVHAKAIVAWRRLRRRL